MICSTKKLFCLAGVAALGMVTAEGSALAQETCADGVLSYTTIEGDVEINGTSCFIDAVLVDGNVTATNSTNLIMIKSTINGDVSVSGGGVAVVSDNLVRGDVDVSGNVFAVVSLNDVDVSNPNAPIDAPEIGGNLTVNDHSEIAYIYRNAIDIDLTCTGNAERKVSQNLVGGEVNCATEDNPGE